MYDDVLRTVELFYSDDNMRVELEYCMGCVFAHIIFHKKSAEAYKKVKKEFGSMLLYVRKQGYQVLYTYTQNPKFVEKLKAQFVNTFDYSGKEYEVWKWELKPLR